MYSQSCLSEAKPENGQRCLVYLGYGWRELYFFNDGSGANGEGFYSYHGDYVNPHKRDPVWMPSPPYPQQESE